MFRATASYDYCTHADSDFVHEVPGNQSWSRQATPQATFKTWCVKYNIRRLGRLTYSCGTGMALPWGVVCLVLARTAVRTYTPRTSWYVTRGVEHQTTAGRGRTYPLRLQSKHRQPPALAERGTDTSLTTEQRGVHRAQMLLTVYLVSASALTSGPSHG